MALYTSSATSLTNLCTTQNNNVIQLVDMVAIDSNHLVRGNILCFTTSRPYMNSQSIKSLPLSLNQMKIRFPTTLAFASAHKKGEAEGGSRVDAIFPDNTNKECTWSFDFPESKVEFSHLESEAYPSGGSIGDNNVASLLEKLIALRSQLLASEKWNASRLHSCDSKYLECATNLIHYLALRSLDIEQLNIYLASLGLSSLDNNNLLTNSPYIKQIVGMEFHTNAYPKQKKGKSTKKNDKGKVLSYKELLLGKLNEGRRTHIMVTVGKEAIESETFVADILKAGASVIHINCAHGDSSI